LNPKKLKKFGFPFFTGTVAWIKDWSFIGIYKALVRKKISSIPLQITLIYYILHDDRLNNGILNYKDIISGNESSHTIFTIITFNKT